MSKRYERMSKEDLISFLYGVKEHKCGDGCVMDKQCTTAEEYYTPHSCTERVALYLLEEIKTKKVHRYELIKAPEDLDKLSEEWKEYCDPRYCVDCKYLGWHANGGSSMCFAEYLKEEIEVEE